MTEAIELSYPDTNRLGKLLILDRALRDDAAMVGALFGLVKVIKEGRHESGRGKEFYVACPADVPLFEPLREGEEIPEYRVEFVYDRKFERDDLEARRVNNGRFGFVAIRNFIIRVPPIQMHIAAREASRAPT